MSTPGNIVMLILLVVGGIAALNVITPSGNTIFEISEIASEMFGSTNNAFAEIAFFSPNN